MPKKINRLAVIVSMFLVPCMPLKAAENYGYICTYETGVRNIEVVYLQEASAVPCEVRYIKDSVSNTLWNAEREPGYCESKAEAFVEKIKGWGWSCDREAAD
ncbi:MAG: hypothetical protein ABGY96_24075 [bacterium]|nr:hypothetical protein [Gammaproteobacteria bacterium]